MAGRSLLGVVLPSVAAATAAAPIVIQPADPSIETVGCYTYGYRFNTLGLDPTDTQSTGTKLENVPARFECQATCAVTTGCQHWAYFAARKVCWLGGRAVDMVADKNAVAGPRVCPKVPAPCTDVPGVGFPGSTVKETFLQFGGQLQPVPLQCWPRLPDGSLDPCASDPAKILMDVKRTWPAECMGLTELPEPTNETCGNNCARKVECPSYQTVAVGDASVGVHMLCWQGMGFQCNNTARSLNVVSSRRYMHGSYRVLKTLMGIAVQGLTPVFPTEQVSDDAAGAMACNETCLSVLACNVWQYSNKYGCYVDAPNHYPVAYPATKPGVYAYDTATSFEDTVVAGEYIQRFCGSLPTATEPASLRSVVSWAEQPTAPTVFGAAVSTTPSILSPAAVPSANDGTQSASQEASLAGQLNDLMGFGGDATVPTEVPSTTQSLFGAVLEPQVFLPSAGTSTTTTLVPAMAALLDAPAVTSNPFLYSTTTTTAAESESSGAWMWWLLLTLLLLLLCALCIGAAAFWYMKYRKSDRKRGYNFGHDRSHSEDEAEVPLRSRPMEYRQPHQVAGLQPPPGLNVNALAAPSRGYSIVPAGFVPSVQQMPTQRLSMAEAGDLFDAFDRNHDGVLTQAEFDALMANRQQETRVLHHY
mmetsp:Transcript_93795/g.264935  ORF Transcript_93795/g.264935 Transcript_93795/m.264935 type:complete len:645 (+) Transcript_93795:100-2034(+)